MKPERELPYRKAKRLVVERIERGLCKSGEKLMPRQLLAKELGVTIATCSKAVDELIAEGWLTSKPCVGTYVAGRAGRPREVFAIVPSLNNMFYAALAEALAKACAEQGFASPKVLGCGYDERASFEAASKMLKDASAILFFYGSANEEMRELLLRRAESCFVFCGPSGFDERLRNLVLKRAEGERLSVKSLLDAGHRRIAHLSTARDSGSVLSSGYLRALKDAGADFMPEFEELMFDWDFSDGARRLALVRAGFERISSLPSPPTAYFCHNDNVAMMLLGICLKKGLRVPEDVSISGYEGIIPDGLLGSYSIASVRQPLDKYFNAAFAAVKSGVFRPELVSFEPELVPGNTTLLQAETRNPKS